jgi:hypothetical protein
MVPAAEMARSFGRADLLAILLHADLGLAGATPGGLKNKVAAGDLFLDGPALSRRVRDDGPRIAPGPARA